jgi:hypothetical protein
MWWIWIVVPAALVLLLGVGLFRSRRGWGPSVGSRADGQAEARTAAWLTRLGRTIGPRR